MKLSSRYVWPGVLALMLSGTTFAHSPGSDPGYGYNGPSGSATIWGDSAGRTGWTGSLSYGIGYGYAPGYVSWGHVHGPRCHHGPTRGHARGYRHGYRHASRHHVHKHRVSKHWRRHH